MATNQYFNHYKATNEQDLIEGMIIESIQTQGFDVAYIPRTQNNINVLFNEDSSNKFVPVTEELEDYSMIEMYPASTDGFDGDQLMSVFGNEFRKSATFIVSRKRFATVFPELGLPRAGDLIYMPITNAILEIRFVDKDSPFFERGKQYVFELRTEMFEYSYEAIEATGDDDIDEVMERLEIENHDTETESYGQNEDIGDEYASEIVYDPNNPFGVR